MLKPDKLDLLLSEAIKENIILLKIFELLSVWDKVFFKSHIRETLNLSPFAGSNTNTKTGRHGQKGRRRKEEQNIYFICHVSCVTCHVLYGLQWAKNPKIFLEQKNIEKTKKLSV